MNRNDLTYQLVSDAFFEEVENLVQKDGYSWHQVGEFFGYKGSRSLENVVKGTHKLKFERVLIAMKALSKRDNYRLHRFILDTKKDVIAPKVSTGEQTLEEMHHELIRQMYMAEQALAAGHHEKAYGYYRFLMKLASKVQEEIQAAGVRLAHESPTGRLLKNTGEWSGSPVRETQRSFR